MFANLGKAQSNITDKWRNKKKKSQNPILLIAKKLKHF